MKRLPSATFLLAAALLLASRDAAAFRDCCFARAIPPRLSGVTVGVANSGLPPWLVQLGRSGGSDPRETVRFVSSHVLGTDLGPGAACGIPAGVVAPVLVGFEPACGPATSLPVWPAPWLACGARDVIRVTAVVPDLQATRRRLGAERVHGMPLLAGGPGPAFEIPELGAIALDLPLAVGTVRLLQPADSTGVVARALAARGEHWWGFAIEVTRADEARDLLERHEVRFLDRREGSHRVLSVLPEDGTRPLVELVRRFETF